MGCFNIMGFHTHLPIVAGDDIVLLLGVYPNYKKGGMRDFCRFAPGFEFTPIALPIFGKYNDYGTITDIERDLNVEVVEKFFNMNIDDLIRLIDDEVVANRYVSDEDSEHYKTLVDKIWNLQPKYQKGSEFEMVYDLTFTIDHRFMFDSIKNLKSSNYDIEGSIKALLELYPPWEDISSYVKKHLEEKSQLKEKFVNGNISEYEYNLLIIRLDYFDPYEKWFNYLNNGKWLGETGYLIDVNPRGPFRHSFWHTIEGFDGDAVLGVYSNPEALHLLFTQLQANFIEFIMFVDEFRRHQWCFGYHVYGTQETHCTTALPYYEKMVDFCKKGYKREEEIRLENEE